MTSRIGASDLKVGYDKRLVIDELSVDIPEASFTVIVGPNACGKSTLLRALSRTLKSTGGTICLDGQDIATLPTKEVARRLGLLPQSTVTPEGITVTDLVSRGRFPHQRFLRQWSSTDQRAVDDALAATRITDLAQRPLDELSGGQRQRAWLAMVLAQQTSLLMLDEPTTFLDIAHQFEVLDLLCDLQEGGYTLVAVLHDLNQAARYASHLICMADGAVVAAGTPQEVMTAERIQQVFGIACEVVADPQTGTPMVIPLARSARRSDPASDTSSVTAVHG